jgi:ribonucleotide reductase alpha subunit
LTHHSRQITIASKYLKTLITFKFNDTEGKTFEIISKENYYCEEHHERFVVKLNPRDNVGSRNYSKKIYTINEEVGEKTITYTNMEDEHNDDERDNLASINDDDNIHVNILHIYFS